MQASPFWKRVMAITGMACFLTLLVTPAYYIKYLIFDSGRENGLAHVAVASPSTLPTAFEYTEYFRTRAENAPEPGDRIQAVEWLTRLILTPYAQITHPVECWRAKLTVGNIAAHDSSPTVQSAATQCMISIEEHGVVISR